MLQFFVVFFIEFCQSVTQLSKLNFYSYVGHIFSILENSGNIRFFAGTANHFPYKLVSKIHIPAHTHTQNKHLV